MAGENPMTTFETTSRVGPDGRLHVAVPPELANTEVRVRVDPALSTNGALPSGTRPARRQMSQDEWRAFIDEFAGSIPDFPDVERRRTSLHGRP
jgi:hypothetical protein